MREYIKKLQSKEEHVRKQILAGAMIVSMSIVGFVWVYNFGTIFKDKKELAQKEEAIKPLTLFKNSVSETYDNISASVGKISFKKENKSAKNGEKEIDLIPVEYINQ